MYLDLGGEMVVAVRDVIAILDGHTVAGSEINQEFIRRASRVADAPGSSAEPAPGARRGGVASWVVTATGVYGSRISVATLSRRMAHFAEHADSWRPQTSGRTRGLRV